MNEDIKKKQPVERFVDDVLTQDAQQIERQWDRPFKLSLRRLINSIYLMEDLAIENGFGAGLERLCDSDLDILIRGMDEWTKDLPKLIKDFCEYRASVTSEYMRRKKVSASQIVIMYPELFPDIWKKNIDGSFESLHSKRQGDEQ